MSGKFWAVIGVIVAVFVGFLVFGGDKNKDTSGTSTTSATNHVKGKTDSTVKFVEYGDFQCPTCGAYYPLIKQVFEKYQDKISFQFRNLPLTQIHNNAFAASRAAEAASAQGKFWEMHDLLYENQQAWSSAKTPTDIFKSFAKQLGLNETQYETDFASSDVNKAINSDIAAFKATKNDLATPSFFLNGKKIELKQVVDENSQPQVEKFYALIDEALKSETSTSTPKATN
ncbi:MAG: thioredoxin domain-containing protein [Candidatus Saccharimonadales bacterium]